AAVAILEEVAPRVARMVQVAGVAAGGHAAGDPVLRLLFCCGARTLDLAAQARLSAVAAELDADAWERLCGLAHVHGMAPLVIDHVARAGLLATAPAQIAGALRQSYAQTLVNNRRLQTILQTVLSALVAEGIPVMAVKGLALALRYYQSLALRPITDIDLL